MGGGIEGSSTNNMGFVLEHRVFSTHDLSNCRTECLFEDVNEFVKRIGKIIFF